MSPPLYSDLGKQARDVFGKGFCFGLLKLDVKTKTTTGVELNSSGVSNQESGKVSGSFEGKYQLKEYNTTISTKWNTSNVLTSKFELKDLLLNGLKITMDTSLNMGSNVKDGKVTAEYRHDLVTLTGDVDLNLSGPLINASAVLGHGNWLAGYQMAYDTAKSKLTKNNVGVGLTANDFVLHLNMNDGQIFGGSIFKKMNKNTECGFTLGWTASANTTTIGLGAKHQLDDCASVRAKINNSRQLGLSYQQKIKDGVTIGLSTLIDGMNFYQGGHKVGMSLELEA